SPRSRRGRRRCSGEREAVPAGRCCAYGPPWSHEAFLEVETQRIDPVLPERRPAQGATTLLEAGPPPLVEPPLHPPGAPPPGTARPRRAAPAPPAPGLAPRVIGPRPAQAPAGGGRTDEHPLAPPVPGAEQLQAAAAGGRVGVPRDEEGPPLAHEPLDAVRVAA